MLSRKKKKYYYNVQCFKPFNYIIMVTFFHFDVRNPKDSIILLTILYKYRYSRNFKFKISASL